MPRQFDELIQLSALNTVVLEADKNCLIDQVKVIQGIAPSWCASADEIMLVDLPLRRRL